MKKCILFVLFALLLTVPVSATEAPRGTCGEELAWILEGDTLTISGYGQMYDYVESPPWYAYRDQIQKVVFAGEVSYVGAYAFEDYDHITAVDFGDHMHTLGIRAFSGCDGLTSISLPASFKVFGEESLRGCPNLKAIHCAGTFPSFKLNCLWQTEAKIYYPADKPWPLSLVKELEEAFSYRIEFLDSDGNDPYTPEETTEATEATEPTQTTETTGTTAPETTAPETTAPTTAAPTETTPPETTRPAATYVVTEPASTAAPPPVWTTVAPTEPPAKKSSGSKVGVALVALVLSGAGIGALIFHSANNKKGKFQ